MFTFLCVAVLFTMFFCLPDTSAPKILYKRAIRRRAGTVNERLRSQIEVDTKHYAVKDNLPLVGGAFSVTFFEPTILLVDLYAGLLHGVFSYGLSPFLLHIQIRNKLAKPCFLGYPCFWRHLRVCGSILGQREPRPCKGVKRFPPRDGPPARLFGVLCPAALSILVWMVGTGDRQLNCPHHRRWLHCNCCRHTRQRHLYLHWHCLCTLRGLNLCWRRFVSGLIWCLSLICKF